MITNMTRGNTNMRRLFITRVKAERWKLVLLYWKIWPVLTNLMRVVEPLIRRPKSGFTLQKKEPHSQKTPQWNRNLGHASNVSVFLQREITRFSTHYKVWLSGSYRLQLKSKKKKEALCFPWQSQKSTLLNTTTKTKTQRAPSPRKRKHFHYSSFQLSKKHTV